MSAPGPNAAATPVLEMIDTAVPSIHTPDTIMLDHVDWIVRPGEYWVVGGLPASGKSDLFATAAGLMRPQRGVVRVFGQELVRLPEEERRQIQVRVGVVFGYGGRLFSHLTVAENLSLPLCYHHNCDPNASEQRVRKVLDLMELAAVASQTPAQLNRSLRQRVALARALVLGPELLFLDNPLVGIDPRESRWWFEFLNQLLDNHPLVESGRPLTIVAGTDDLEPWSARGRQFAVISGGRLVPVGGPADLAQSSIPALRALLPADWLNS